MFNSAKRKWNGQLFSSKSLCQKVSNLAALTHDLFFILLFKLTLIILLLTVHWILTLNISEQCIWWGCPGECFSRKKWWKRWNTLWLHQNQIENSRNRIKSWWTPNSSAKGCLISNKIKTWKIFKSFTNWQFNKSVYFSNKIITR